MTTTERIRTEQIATKTGVILLIERSECGDEVEISLRTERPKQLILHWGVRQDSSGSWQMPPHQLWPSGTRPFGSAAAQTPFTSLNGRREVVVHLPSTTEFSAIEFALLFPEENRWDNNNGRNYRISIPAADRRRVSPAQTLRPYVGDEPPVFERVYELEDGNQLAAAVISRGDVYELIVITNVPGSVLLHWGIARWSSSEWLLPPASLYPPQTTVWQNTAAETVFGAQPGGLNQLKIEIPREEGIFGIPCVLKQVDTGRWIKNDTANFFFSIEGRSASPSQSTDQELAAVADEIIGAETARNSWTLMHRFNLCYDLLDRAPHSREIWALLFCWLRFSIIRQLDWQRNYNTKPRELSHSQDRLTLKLAGLYAAEPASHDLVRLMMTTLGRGGEGQRIRDEILSIMHRHNIKEAAGHFMEEWHQKLHNNTTPDDVVICEAYLAFLRSNGNRDTFYQTLGAGGISKARLESFERPIRSDPVFVPHLKDGLIQDFEHFLRTLKQVHSGTDLETAINAASYALDDETRGLVRDVMTHRSDPQYSVVALVDRATEIRRRLVPRLTKDGGSRDLLYLDLALEQSLRAAVERNLHLQLQGDQLVELIASLTENLVLSHDDVELEHCFRHWGRLMAMPRFGREWSLHANSVVDRMARALAALTDSWYRLLQPKAELLGNGFHAEPWTITNFSEEVVRGGLGFALSALIQHLTPLLRKSAHIGSWQVISRGVAFGRLQMVDELVSIQGKKFDGPTVVLAGKVAGEEEIPQGVNAIIASTETDILSHVAVRARNAGVLLATCYDSQILDQLRSWQGRTLRLEVSGADVAIREAEDRDAVPFLPSAVRARRTLPHAQFRHYAVAARDFNESLVGRKSSTQASLRGKLPDWVHQPSSVAIPFGVLENVLALELNKAVAKRYQELVASIERDVPSTLAELRRTVLELSAPDELESELRSVMQDAGLTRGDDWNTLWERVWMCIKRVWSSKWNDRAYLSRKVQGIPDGELQMAVLIQDLVPADYAFVIHTVNPSSGAKEDLYAEIVLGLGETLVGNYPGRALSFTCNKESMQLNLLAYPGKSIGLYAEGLIFRSDSNGEDLAGYAGAGLYDSVTLNAPRRVLLDYSQETIVWDADFRKGMLLSIARIGIAVEGALGSSQDIEGVYSKGEYYLVQARPQVG